MRLKNVHIAVLPALTRLAALAAAMVVVFVLSATATYAGDEGNILEPQHGIPLVIINIDESEEAIAQAGNDDPDHQYGTIAEMNASANHTVRCVGDVEIKVPEGYELPEGDLSWIGTNLKLEYIRGRGNSTWDGPKRPYKIKLSKKADLFGMGKSKEWALMANTYDHTLMKNRITYWLGAQLGMPYTIESVPVDFVMTGAEGAAYLGCYELSETVKIGDTRVAIDELDVESEDVSIAGEMEYQKTGGYLFSIFASSQKDDPESNTFTTTNQIDFHFDNPEYLDEANLTDWQKEQRQYLKEYVQYIEDLIVNSDEIDLETHNKIAEVLDLESVADYWLIQELTRNGDAFLTGSTYFFKPRGDKLYFGPLWDFDLAWGDRSEDEEDDIISSSQDLNFTDMLWINELRAKDPEFIKIVEQEWAELDPALTELTKSGGFLDQCRDEISDAYNADPTLAENEDANLNANTEGLRRWIDYRHSWFGNNLDKIGAVYSKVTYIVDGEIIFENAKVRIGHAAWDDPEAPEKEDLFFTGWFTEDGTPRADVEIVGDTVFYAKYVDAEHAVLPEDLYFLEYEIWVEADSIIDTLYDYTVFPSDAVSDKLRWKSSDESIVTVDKTGVLLSHNAGDVILTAATVNGLEKEILVHVVEPEAMNPKEPEGIVADESVIKLNVGERTQAKWHFLPEGEPIKKDNITFDTSDDQVAVTDSLGVITALEPGTATITATAFYNEDDKVSTTFKVIVTDPNKQDKPSADDKVDSTAAGTSHKVSGSTYKIIKNAAKGKAGTAALSKAANKKSFKVPAVVTIDGKKFNVTRIDAGAFKAKKIRTVTISKNIKTIKKNAFKGSKATKLIIKSKGLTKKSVKGSLKKSKIKKVQVKIGKKSVNKKYVKKYKKIFTKKNAGKKVKIS